jgi:hypothetical protein
MKKTLGLLLILFANVPLFSTAQTGSAVRHKLALFAPLYLDSAFDAGGNYRYAKSFPQFVNPGLEFYMGAQMALDSLKKMGAPLDVYVYDTRSKNNALAQQAASFEMKDAELFIANASQPEIRILADEAQKKKIPLISATLPNDAGITNNPYYVILNSTLRTHCEGIYRYIQKYHSLDRIIVYRKSGTQEDQIKEYLQDAAKTFSSTQLKIEFKDIGSDFDASLLARGLDTIRQTVCIAGSLDENFGLNLARSLTSIAETYPLTIIGMPTWEGISDFSKPEFKNVDITYTTPFYYARANNLSYKLASEFESLTKGRPTDMFYRGYETTLRFALLLLDTGKDVASNLTRPGNYVFTSFDIEPVFLNKQNMTLDYFENKKLYFVRYLNGAKTVQ